jgi:hypothetical protein
MISKGRQRERKREREKIITSIGLLSVMTSPAKTLEKKTAQDDLFLHPLIDVRQIFRVTLKCRA